jgi:hypothetical protein
MRHSPEVWDSTDPLLGLGLVLIQKYAENRLLDKVVYFFERAVRAL